MESTTRYEPDEKVFSPSLTDLDVEVKSHTSGFRTNTYPDIVGLADKVYNFATTAGGRGRGSYYKLMLDSMSKLNEAVGERPKDEAKIKKLGDGVLWLVKKQQSAIDELIAASKKLQSTLHTFVGTCKQDEQHLIDAQKGVKNAISGPDGAGGHMRKIQDEIDSLCDELSDEQGEYDWGTPQSPHIPKFSMCFADVTIIRHAESA